MRAAAAVVQQAARGATGAVSRRRALSAISSSSSPATVTAPAAPPSSAPAMGSRRPLHHQAMSGGLGAAPSLVLPSRSSGPAASAWRTSLGGKLHSGPRRDPAPVGVLLTDSLLSLTGSQRRGITTQARRGPGGGTAAAAAATTMAQSPLAAAPLTGLRQQPPLVVGQSRGFWSPRFMRQIGVPWIVQVFYGTLLMVGVGVLAVSVFATSAVFAVLFVLAFAGFRLFARRPQLVRQVLRRPAQTPAGAFLRPLLEMVTEGMLMDGLKNARHVIERDVLAAVNAHRQLRAYGQDFEATGLHSMSLQAVDGEQHVVMEFLIVSSKPREVLVRVAASHHEEAAAPPAAGADQPPPVDRWDYESVTARTPDGKVYDLTGDVAKAAGGSRRIVIDAPFRVKEEREERR